MASRVLRQVTIAGDLDGSGRITGSEIGDPLFSVFVGGCLAAPGRYVHVDDMVAAVNGCLLAYDMEHAAADLIATLSKGHL